MPNRTLALAGSTAVAALGGLLFGFDTAVIAGAIDTLRQTFHLSAGSLGLTVSSALWGTVVGALAAGIPADRYGRRATLILCALLYVLSALGCLLARSWPEVVLARFVGGLGIGASSVAGPMYIAEIAPPGWRGRLVGLFQINIVVGILLAYVSNYLLGRLLVGPEQWRWKLGSPGVPAFLFLLFLLWIPQSPRWLVAAGETEQARRVLQQLGRPVEAELREIAAGIEQERQTGRVRLFSRRYRYPIFLAVTLALFNQLSGINAILYYLNDIFRRAGFGTVSADMQAVAVGATNLVFTLIAMAVIDRLGRRTLLLSGALGMAACQAGVAWVFLHPGHAGWLVWLLAGFIACFAFSQGAVIWVYLSEVFPTPVRGAGQSLGSFVHWLMNAIISWSFPGLAERSGGYPFLFFAAMMVLQFFVVWRWFPETRGVALEQIQRRLVTAD
jgi:sugar porter (SP) family MFS transporter